MNRNAPLKNLLYKSLVRPIITYSSPVWFGTSNTNLNKLQRLQNEILRFTPNTQIHRETNTPTIKDFITTLTLNFHSRLPLTTEVLCYNIGQTSTLPRLKPRLSQDVLNLRLTMLNTYKKKCVKPGPIKFFGVSMLLYCHPRYTTVPNFISIGQ
jgi:hypothetical protein